MIEFISSWAKSLGLAIVIVSILEMLLPNNKNKKYIRMVMGIYILFNIVSPFINNKDIFNIEDIDIEKYALEQETSSQLQSEEVDQTSMNKRIEELYIEELEKDITKKIEEQGYEVESCTVKATISDEEDKSGIEEIRLRVKKNENNPNNEVNENSNIQDEESSNGNLENKIVTEIQKIKKIDTSISNNENLNKDSSNDSNKNNKENSDVSKTDIQNIKKFLIEEYEVNEKCLKIN